MSDPIETAIINVQAQEEFLIQQAELRQTRARWVDEHERPVPMVVMDDKGKVAYPATFKDTDGNERRTPFMLGCQTYSDEMPHEADPESATGYKRRAITFLPDATTEEQEQVRAQMREVSGQYNQFSGTMLDRGVPLSHKSDHPPIREGETHEEWFNRVRKTYSDAPQGDADAGSSGAGVDGVRKAAGDDPRGGRPGPGLGPSDRGAHSTPGLHCEPIADRARGPVACVRGGEPQSATGRLVPAARRPSFPVRCAAAISRVCALFRKRDHRQR